MRPYRHRSLPLKSAVRSPAKAEQPTVTKPPDSTPYYDMPQMDTTSIFLLASFLMPHMQEDMQRLYSYLPPHAQSVASAAITVKDNSAQLMESARIRAAIQRHDGHGRADADPHSFLDVLTQTNLAKKRRLQEPIARTADAVDNVHSVHATLSELKKEGSHAFLSRQFESKIKQSLGDIGPLFNVIKPRQHVKDRGEHWNGENPGNPIIDMLTGGKHNNPLLSMLMQNISGKRPLNNLLSMPAPHEENME